MKVGFIGAGKVGFSLGKFFTERGIHLTGYYSRQTGSAEAAAGFTGSKAYTEIGSLVKESDVVFLTVPDGAISETFGKIKDYDISGKQICHCSGALAAAEAFPGIAERGAFGYSIHPLFPVSSKLTSYRELPDAFFCLEGDGPHMEVWLEFFRENCRGVKRIESGRKVQYHAACAVASNLYCALMQESVELLSGCGFTQREALDALAPLVRSNLEHILADGPVKALTGPVERGDAGTVRKHLECLGKAGGGRQAVGAAGERPECLEKAVGETQEAGAAGKRPECLEKAGGGTNAVGTAGKSSECLEKVWILGSERLSEDPGAEDGSDLELYRVLSRKLVQLAKQKNPDREYGEVWECLGDTGKGTTE